MNDIIDTLTDLDALSALSLVGVLIAVLCSLMAMLLAARQKTPPPRNGEDHYPVAGRIEKLERSLNQFRTDALRALELMRQDLKQIGTAVGVKTEAPEAKAEEAGTAETPPPETAVSEVAAESPVSETPAEAAAAEVAEKKK